METLQLVNGSSFVMLASFTLIDPGMLWWLAAAIIPVLIHLWYREKYEETSWAAMRFLAIAVRRHSRRLVVRQWFLLFLRCLLIVLLVLAVAGPAAHIPENMLQASAAVTHQIIVIDASYSMGCRANDKTPFDLAKDSARQIVSAATTNDKFSLISMSGRPQIVLEQSTLPTTRIIREIETLSLKNDAADMPATIGLVRQAIDNCRASTPDMKHIVYFISDMQQNTWLPPDDSAFTAALRAKFVELTSQASLVIIDVGQNNMDNVAIARLDLLNPPAIVGRPLQFAVSVTNFGNKKIERQAIDFLIDGQKIERKETDIEAQTTASTGFSYKFNSSGDHVIEVQTTPDVLELDNHRFLVVPVLRKIRTLCIDGGGSPTETKPQRDTYYLALALNPGQYHGKGQSNIEVEISDERAIVEKNLTDYDCVFLCNVAQFTVADRKLLNTYLQQGGNLFVFLGDRISPENYNENYNEKSSDTKQGRAAVQSDTQEERQTVQITRNIVANEKTFGSFFPVTVGKLIDKPVLRLDPLDYRHAVLKPFQNGGATSLITAPILKYFQLSLKDSHSGATVVLAADNGDPVLIESPVYSGRLWFCATSAEPSWNTMPLWPGFVPLVQEMVAWSVGNEMKHRNILVHQNIELAIRGNVLPATIKIPNGMARQIEKESPVFSDTSEAGIYVIQPDLPGRLKKTFAVNLDTSESNLSAITENQLRRSLLADVAFDYRTPGEDSMPTTKNMRLHPVNISVYLLYTVLLLLLLETALSMQLPENTIAKKLKS